MESLSTSIPDELAAILQDSNPWWRSESLYDVPQMHRWAFQPVLNGLIDGMTPAVVLRGPRQIGKTTLLNQIIQTLLDQGVEPKRILRIQFDELPVLKKCNRSRG